jgi:signal transduction histidine kinase
MFTINSLNKFDLESWKNELESSILESNTLCIALFKKDGELIFANNAIKVLFRDLNPASSFLNPTFETLSKNDCPYCNVYKGYITFGDYSSVNSSIMANVYRKDDSILIIGGVDSEQLMQQNLMMHNLNREIGNLQRQLIKEKRILEETLIKLNSTVKELNEANATKDKFFSIIAHDLKNPFTTIIGFTEYLKTNLSTMEPAEVEEIVEMMNSSGHTTYKLLEDLLLWSRSQLGKIIFTPARTNLSELWNEVSNSLLLQAEKKNITICFSDTNESEFFCDKNMVKTIIRNLVSNAIKFSYRDSTIEINTSLNNNFCQIKISDKGVGIDPEIIESLWTIGSHHSTSGTESEQGSGLGLVICKEFTQANGGKIWVDSEKGKGSDFIFTLPLYN